MGQTSIGAKTFTKDLGDSATEHREISVGRLLSRVPVFSKPSYTNTTLGKQTGHWAVRKQVG